MSSDILTINRGYEESRRRALFLAAIKQPSVIWDTATEDRFSGNWKVRGRVDGQEVSLLISEQEMRRAKF